LRARRSNEKNKKKRKRVERGRKKDRQRTAREEGKGDERRGKRAGIFFGKSGKPKRPVEFHTMAFYTTVKRTTYLW